MKKIVYVTGCLGFIGYHVTKRCLDEGFYVYGVDKQTYASNTQFLPDLLKNPQFKYSDCDINDIERLVDCDYVINTAAAVLRIIESGVKNDIFNISGNYEESNLVVVQKIMNLFGGITDYASHISDLHRPGQDVRYSIDDSKLKSLGWQPTANFDEELAVIVEYYKNNFVW